MSTFKQSFRGVGPLLFAVAAIAGVAMGACRQDDGDESDASLDVRNSCDDYCARARECNDETNEEKCKNRCIDALTDCQADEQDEAIDRLDVCGNESCDDFIGCSINVGAQCIFGL